MARHYLALSPKKRVTYLSSTVDKVIGSDEVTATEPRDVDTIEWFASPDDLCRMFSGLRALQG
jgi:hypothetical protein